MQKQRKLQYIAVDGPIGAGKATLVKMLAEDLGGETLFETSDKNPFLQDFYKNPKENAFKAQIYFLLNRFQQQADLKQRDMFDRRRLWPNKTIVTEVVYVLDKHLNFTHRLIFLGLDCSCIFVFSNSSTVIDWSCSSESLGDSDGGVLPPKPSNLLN